MSSSMILNANTPSLLYVSDSDNDIDDMDKDMDLNINKIQQWWYL